MKFYVGITDWDWFKKLSSIEGIDEINFWRPSGYSGFRALQPGELFLFKLHHPKNFIVGGGIFSNWIILPLSFAWNSFKEKNGADSEDEMRRRINKYRPNRYPAETDYKIGCILLQQPFF